MIKGIVTTHTLPLRINEAPSASSRKVGNMPIGAEIEIKYIEDHGDGWGWAYVYYKKIQGFACMKEPTCDYWYIEVTDTGEPPAEQAPPDGGEESEEKENINVNFNPDIFPDKVISNIQGDPFTQDTQVHRLNNKFGLYWWDESGTIHDINSVTHELSMKAKIQTNRYKSPEYIVNDQNFPVLDGRKHNGIYTYDYNMDYTGITNLDFHIREARYNLNIPRRTNREAFLDSIETYNRFKVPEISNVLTKSFAHVFFVRPDLNILRQDTSAVQLNSALENNAEFYYAYKHCPEILTSLVTHNGSNNDFMMLLSNKVNSFAVSDEYIKTDTYGEGWTGYKIPYGKHNIESKASGTIDLSYTDDRNLNIYHLHKIWTDYISMVYRGQIHASEYNIYNKILDYATAIYYILTAEDGETIIFWTKYYGVFPTNSPSSVTSWTKGSLLNNPDYNVQYTYAWKRDFDPLTLVEFNKHTSPNAGSQYKYVKTYNSTMLGTGNSFVGAPFIETVLNDSLGGERYTFKLRFMPRTD